MAEEGDEKICSMIGEMINQKTASLDQNEEKSAAVESCKAEKKQLKLEAKKNKKMLHHVKHWMKLKKSRQDILKTF